MLTLAKDLDEGYSEREIARKFEQHVSWVSERLDWLRNEVALQTGFLPLTDEEYQSLKDSIEEYGVRSPVIISAPPDRKWKLLDGRHRWSASLECGRTDIPVVFLDNLSEQEEHDLSVMLNVARRHLRIDQKRDIVRSELKRDWGRSDRWIAKVSGVSPPTVAAVRGEMRAEDETLALPVQDEEAEAFDRYQHPEPVQKPLASKTAQPSGEVKRPLTSEPEFRRGADDKLYPVKPRVEPTAKQEVLPPEKPEAGTKIKLGYVVIPDGVLPGETVEIWYDGTYYMLVASRD